MCDADPMDSGPDDSAVASDIAVGLLRERVRSVRPIGQGSNNKNFLVETADGRAVVKLSHEHRRHRALQDYKKEKWCIEQSAALGVPGPSVLSVGEIDGNAYMIETFVGASAARRSRETGPRSGGSWASTQSSRTPSRSRVGAKTSSTTGRAVNGRPG